MILEVLAGLLGIYLVVCGAAWALQPHLVFFPGPPPSDTPAAFGLQYQDVRLQTSDAVALHGWWLPAREPRGAMIVSHGNAGSIEYRLGLARAFLAMDLSVLLYDYRGYGSSEGSPSETGTYRDAEAAWDFVAAQGFPASRVVLYGESLGGAVSIELAGLRTPAALLVESTFTSIPDVGAEVYPWLPVRLLARIRYDNRSKIATLAVPLLVIHSTEDELIPFAHGRRLYDAAPGPKELLETEGGHNDGGFRSTAGGQQAVARFLDEWLPARG